VADLVEQVSASLPGLLEPANLVEVVDLSAAQRGRLLQHRGLVAVSRLPDAAGR
jgi:hypothetical protein